MAKYVYPAVFTAEDGQYSVFFPDLEGCYTCGDTLAEAIEMAEDVLAFTLYSMEKRHEPIPVPSVSRSISVDENSFVNLIACDTIGYQRRNNTRSVKKTLS
ncbi:MAG: type II toxin-antitoxin system HicB family antitoxin [Lachnospiraceae bacterium]|nr:type II toxin-antitoxin system HicB family antitoxin [Lachnospiraceae bacterium]